ncbi:MAG: hypothetical protein KDB33_09310, partial [Acidimicrobiales bacterium]|nr:hypothetical protein [Acidimicrobiales bacterium]
MSLTDLGEAVVARLGLRPPRDLDEAGVPEALLQDLTLRRALFEGRTSTLRLAEGLCVSPQLVTKLIEDMRELRLFEIQGLDGRDYQLALTDHGRQQAQDRMQLSRYAGAAPVPLSEYSRVVLAQRIYVDITRDAMRTAFSDLVINDALLDEVGPALIAEGAMFLYGPPGTGKTSIAERMIRIYTDPVVVPRAVEVDSQIIQVFDPAVHIAIEPQPAEIDRRWVLCHRPAIIAGGELQADSLDLRYESSTGIYLAPLQMQANNGIFVIDDFGRQLMTPAQLLNRWIVPLDRRLDFLSLAYGVKFQIPFETKIVLSTNLEPASLGDEAFFRRIQSKIFVRPISDEEFDEVLRRVSAAYGVEVQNGAPAYLRKVSRENGDGDLRPYLPGEVCKILRSVCQYQRAPLVLDPANIDRIAAVYFTKPGNRDVSWQTAAQSV